MSNKQALSGEIYKLGTVFNKEFIDQLMRKTLRDY